MLHTKLSMYTYGQIYLVICFFIIHSAFPQSTIEKNPLLLKSVVTAVGASSSVALKTPTRNYYIQQSVGQSGMIGLAAKNNLYVQQGFLNNANIIKIDNSSGDFEKTINLTVYPNRVVEYVTILFSEKPTEPIEVGVFDIRGRLIFTEKHPPSIELTMPIRSLAEGVYLLQIISGKRKGLEKIIKLNK
jgi:hypothetical protein